MVDDPLHKHIAIDWFGQPMLQVFCCSQCPILLKGGFSFTILDHNPKVLSPASGTLCLNPGAPLLLTDAVRPQALRELQAH